MKKVMISVLCLALFLMACSIIEFPETTGNPIVVSRPISCVDSDNGRNYNVAGSVTLTYSDGTAPRNLADRCETATRLREYSCSGTNVYSATTSCVSCVDGACVGGVAAVQRVCTDTDGGVNYEVYGEMRVDGGTINRDTCAMGNLDNPGDTVVQSCDGDGTRCKLLEKSCARDGSGVHGKYVVPVGKKCENGRVIDDPCPEEKSYFCDKSSWKYFELTKKCGVEQSRTELRGNGKCSDGKQFYLACNWQTGVGVWRESFNCGELGCSVIDSTRCCSPLLDNLQMAAPGYCDGNTFVNATYIGCDGQQNVPERQSCDSLPVSINQNVPGQCQTVEGETGCFACNYEYCFGGQFGGTYFSKSQNGQCYRGGHAVNITCA